MRVDQATADALRLAPKVLETWDQHVWTAMGFGMVRTYLDDAKRWRLNIWDDRLRVPEVSEIHDHPWDFTSYICCGQISNIRFKLFKPYAGEPGAADFALPFQHVQIKTGEGGGPTGPVDEVKLVACRPEIYMPGESYRQFKDEIHITRAVRGTVTLNDRSPPTPEHTANIYWPHGPWVDAEPRQATQDEVYNAVCAAARQTELLRVLA